MVRLSPPRPRARPARVLTRAQPGTLLRGQRDQGDPRVRRSQLRPADRRRRQTACEPLQRHQYPPPRVAPGVVQETSGGTRGLIVLRHGLHEQARPERYDIFVLP